MNLLEAAEAMVDTLVEDDADRQIAEPSPTCDLPIAVVVSARLPWWRRAIEWPFRLLERVSDRIWGPPGPNDWMI